MAIKRITVSVPEETAARMKKAAAGMPVSSWVTKLIEAELDQAALEHLWRDFYREVQPGRDAIRRADAVMKRHRQRARRKGAA